MQHRGESEGTVEVKRPFIRASWKIQTLNRTGPSKTAELRPSDPGRSHEPSTRLPR